MHREVAPHQVAHVERSHRLTASGDWATPEVGAVISRQNGKTDTVLARLLAEVFTQPSGRALYVAHSGEVAREVWKAACELVERVPLLDRLTSTIRRTNGQEAIETTRGGVLRVLSATGKPPRGFRRVGLIVYDELMHHAYTPELLAALNPTQAAHPRPQTWYTSSAGDDRSTVLNRLRARGEAAAAAGSPGPLSWSHWAAPDGCDLLDEAALAAANPALGRWLRLDYLRRAADELPEPLYRTEHLGQWVPLVEAWLPLGALDALADPAATVPDGAPVTFGLDAEGDLTGAALAAAYLRPDGRVHVETVAAPHPHGGPVTVQLRARVLDLAARWRGARFLIGARSPLAPLADTLAAERVRVELVGDAERATAVQGFAELVTAAQLVHPSDPPLLAAAAAAVPARRGPVITYRLDTPGMSPLTAAVYAAHGARAKPGRAIIRAVTS